VPVPEPQPEPLQPGFNLTPTEPATLF
jgi:hypothetical protein